MESALKIKFPHTLHVKVPTGLSAAIDEAARARCTSGSELIRQLLIRGLRDEGLFLSEPGKAAQQGGAAPWRG
jgi:hypothetical protein